MQIIKGTFDGMKRLGLIPQDADFNNPNHSKRAGEIHAEYLFDKYQGDARKAAAAYYSGEGVVKRDGTIGNYSDPKNAKAPTTHQYADQIAARLSKG